MCFDGKYNDEELFVRMTDIFDEIQIKQSLDIGPLQDSSLLSIFCGDVEIDRLSDIGACCLHAGREYCVVLTEG